MINERIHVQQENIVQREQVAVVAVHHESNQIQHSVVVKRFQKQHIHVQQESIYQQTVQHVATVHVDIIVQD